MQKANRQELFQILAFLDSKLPAAASVNFQVQVHSRTDNPAYGVYFIRQSENEEYSAIAAIKQDERQNASDQKQRIWFVYGWAADGETLASLYASVDVIDWCRDDLILFDDSLNDNVSKAAISALYQRRGVEPELTPLHRYVIDRQSALNLQLNFPDDIYVKSLEQHHAQVIYDTWAFKTISCVQAVRNNINDLPSAGVFTKDGDRLVAWIIGHNGMNRLYTIEEYRRRGYATYATLYLSKRMAQAGYQPYVHISPHNHDSIAFFENKGFKYVLTACMHQVLS